MAHRSKYNAGKSANHSIFGKEQILGIELKIVLFARLQKPVAKELYGS